MLLFKPSCWAMTQVTCHRSQDHRSFPLVWDYDPAQPKGDITWQGASIHLIYSFS